MAFAWQVSSHYHPVCFHPWTFSLNVGLGIFPLDSFMSCLYSLLGYSTGEFQALQLIVLAAFGVVDWPLAPCVLVHFLEVWFWNDSGFVSLTWGKTTFFHCFIFWCLKVKYFIFICLVFMSLVVLYFLWSTLVLSFCIDIVLILSIWANAGLLSIRPLRTYFDKISFGNRSFSFQKMLLKMSSAICRPFDSAFMCWQARYGFGSLFAQALICTSGDIWVWFKTNHICQQEAYC